MTHAYARMYLADSEDCLSNAFDYAVHDCKVSGDVFASAFIRSGLAHGFERGNPVVVSGMTGIELACSALTSCGLLSEVPEPTYSRGLSPEYWAGWAIAQYQWSRACRFADLFSHIPFSRIVSLYDPLHEADISVFMDRLDSMICQAGAPRTRLARLRKLRGLTQEELSRAAGVSLKSIQAYEQRVNDLGKATAETVLRIAWTLGCSVEDLLEFVPRSSIEYDSARPRSHKTDMRSGTGG